MKYGPEITSEIAGYLEHGSNRTDAATLAGISFETFNEWRKERSEFAEAVKKAEAICKHRNIGVVQKAAITTWQAAAWWLERKHPDEFALKGRDDASPGQKEEASSRMVERAAEILKKVQGRIPIAPSTNGNGLHP